MSAYILVSFTPIDTEKLQQYATAVPATLVKYSGEMLAKGAIETLHGNSGFTMQAIIVFPDKALAAAWYGSDDYQALMPLRDAGMNAQFQLLG